MALDKVDRSFLGTGWAFPPEFNRHSRAATMVSEDEDIRESLRILLATTPGERIMQPAYGCELKKLVFDNISTSSLTEIKDAVERAVVFLEPRIILNGITVDTEKINDGLIRILVDYTIRVTNTRSNMVYPFYFREGTDVRA